MIPILSQVGKTAVFLSAFLGALFLFASPRTALAGEPPPSERERAVLLAREGRVAEGIALLEELHRARPGDPLVLGDLLVVLQWGGKDARVLELAPGLDLSAAPAYVGEAVARAARNLGRFETAIPLYRSLRGRFPERWTSALGLALSLSESGRPAEGLALARELAALHPENAEILLGLAWIHRHRREHFETLRLSERVLALQPENAAAHRLRILATADLGAPFLALQEAEKRPGALSRDELRRLRSERASQAVRWGELPSPSPAERFAATDRAIALLEKDLEELPPDAPARRRVRLDRLVALRDRFRMEEAVAEYRALEAEGRELPPFLLRAAGDAFFHLRRPEEAVRLYRRALEGMPDDFETRMALFYALVEAEEWEEAFALADALAEQKRSWLWREGAREGSENPEKTEADAAVRMVRAYGDMLGEAQEGLEGMVRRAPGSVDLRQKLAAVYRWRGWPRRALEEYRIVLARDPQNLQGRLGAVSALMDLREYAAAAPEVEELRRRYPENRQVADLAKRWERLRQWEFTAEAGYARGEETQIGTREWSLESRLYAPSAAGRWRPFLHTFFEEAKFPEGSASYRRAGLGVEYEGPRWRLAGEADVSVEGEADPGVSVEGEWRPDDVWSVSARFASFSTEVPLRARREDIDGQSYRLSVLRRWHESRSLRLGAGLLDMSDGNRRVSGSLALEERLLTRPRYRLSGTAELYVSENSRDDASYFNPRRDLAASLGVAWEGLLYRRYERSFRHRLLLALGAYGQSGFATRPILTAGYEQEWRPGPDLGVRYGATWTSRVYDGDREERLGYHLGMDWRF